MFYWFPLNPSTYKYQVVHVQKFKDLLSNTCQVSVERIVLDLESEAMRGSGYIPTRGNILTLWQSLTLCVNGPSPTMHLLTFRKDTSA